MTALQTTGSAPTRRAVLLSAIAVAGLPPLRAVKPLSRQGLVSEPPSKPAMRCAPFTRLQLAAFEIYSRTDCVGDYFDWVIFILDAAARAACEQLGRSDVQACEVLEQAECAPIVHLILSVLEQACIPRDTQTPRESFADALAGKLPQVDEQLGHIRKRRAAGEGPLPMIPRWDRDCRAIVDGAAAGRLSTQEIIDGIRDRERLSVERDALAWPEVHCDDLEWARGFDPGRTGLIAATSRMVLANERGAELLNALNRGAPQSTCDTGPGIMQDYLCADPAFDSTTLAFTRLAAAILDRHLDSHEQLAEVREWANQETWALQRPVVDFLYPVEA